MVYNRYNYAKPVVGFIHGFGLKNGAIASSIAHDSHNIISIGVEDEHIIKAINIIVAEKGGISISGKEGQHILSLPIAGLMSHKSAENVAKEYELMNQLTQKLGSNLSAPFMTMSFMALLVIPELKIGDLGLFDVNKFQLTSLFEE